MNLQLSLKTKWFEMTKAGIKTEDYREINEYWARRILDFSYYKQQEINDIIARLKKWWSLESIAEWDLCNNKWIITNTMTLGYPKSTDIEKIIQFEHAGIEIRTGNPEWGAEPDKLYFVIKHGKRIN